PRAIALATLLAVSSGAWGQSPPENESPPADEPPSPNPKPNDTSAEEEAFFADDPEESFFQDGEDVKEKAPEEGKGAIVGSITDGTDLPAVQALVKVVGTGLSVETSLSGTYRLDLPPGTYKLRIIYPLHETVTLENIEVKPGATVELDEKLPAQEGVDVDPIVVEIEADESSIEGQLIQRKRASVVGDSIAREEIARTPDRNAAAAVRRVVGVIIVDGKFVYVRGIGERYTNALLDGSPLPSPEPEQQTVPLDLFPTNVLDSLTVVKTFTPDQIGNFAGGSIRIGTRRLPTEFSLSLSASLGINSQTTFQDFYSYQGGNLDWLGVDDGSRSRPSEFEGIRVRNNVRQPDGSFFTNEQLAELGRAIDRPMSTRTTLAPPNHRFSLTVGNTFDLDDEKKLGTQLSASYSRSFQTRRNVEVVTADSTRGGEGLLVRNDYRVDDSVDRVRWSLLGGLTYKHNDDHSLHLTGLYAISTDDTAFELEGPDRERGNLVHETRLSFESRNLVYGQLRGEHEFPELGDARLDWNASLANARRDQPDTRATVFTGGSLEGVGGFVFEDDSQSGFHFFSDLNELSVGTGLDWLQRSEE
ncbi:MAG: TonB-dependent receptor, partial [Myxococcota bacterium]